MNPVLILCHNAIELTKSALDSLAAQDVPIHILAIDNHSKDGTYPALLDRGVQSYRCLSSIGVSRAWNYGLRYFFEMGEQHVLVVNNDVVLRPDTYRELLADDGLFVTCVGVNTLEESQKQFVKTVRPHPDFSCFLIRRKVWETIGPFDESMVLYASDADYHMRMHIAGIPAYTIGLPFYHVASGTIKYNPEEAAEIKAQADKDRAVFVKKWGMSVGSEQYNEVFK